MSTKENLSTIKYFSINHHSIVENEKNEGERSKNEL